MIRYLLLIISQALKMTILSSLSPGLNQEIFDVQFKFMSLNMIWSLNQTTTHADLLSGTISEYLTRLPAELTGSTLSTFWSQILFITTVWDHLCTVILKLANLAKDGHAQGKMFAIIRTQWRRRLKVTILLWLLAFSLHTIMTLYTLLTAILIHILIFKGTFWDLKVIRGSV